MRVLHFINSLATGGAERLVVDLVGAASRAGMDARILTISDTAGVPKDYANQHGLEVMTAGVGLRDPRIIPRLRREASRADIVHVHLFPALYWATAVQGPKVFTEHSTWNRRIADRRLQPLERRVYRTYSAVAAISDGVADVLGRHFAHLGIAPPLTVVPNGIRGEFYAHAQVRGHRTSAYAPLRLVSVCSLTGVKNVALAIRAVAQVPYASLDVAGEGPLHRDLEALIVDLGVSDRVRLVGRVSDVPAFLAGADLFISTSKWEGFGLSVAEALASGLPVVGPLVPGVSEVVSDGVDGALFAGDAVSAVVDAINLVGDPVNYAKMSRAAIDLSARFSIGECASRYQSLYAEVLGE